MLLNFCGSKGVDLCLIPYLSSPSAIDVGRSRPYGDSVRVLGALNVVGVFVGCHGTGHLLRDLRDRHGNVRLLLRHEAGI